VAVEVGWESVENSMAGYGALPTEYLNDRAGYAAALKAALLES
jgi:hypothetical protein